MGRTRARERKAKIKEDEVSGGGGGGLLNSAFRTKAARKEAKQSEILISQRGDLSTNATVFLRTTSIDNIFNSERIENFRVILLRGLGGGACKWK